MPALIPVARDLWAAETPLRVYGLRLTARTTVARLADGGLWLHSPLGLAGLRTELDQLGWVHHLVAPNRMHHMGIGSFKRAFPGARLHAVPGLHDKRPDLEVDGELSDEAPPAWAGQIDQVLVRGNETLSEAVFLHRGSRSLILTDIAVHLDRAMPLPVRLLALATGRSGRLVTLPHVKRMFTDRRAARLSLDRILAWDFDRVVMAHGAIVEQDAKAQLADAFDWLRP
ncbi:MAG TPA: DUF4336 domain-containing protein [Alphaproteobacteria bacterium]|nr:DUF4336 domain-containing protein [Alphaproteobacteria bacterium]